MPDDILHARKLQHDTASVRTGNATESASGGTPSQPLQQVNAAHCLALQCVPDLLASIREQLL